MLPPVSEIARFLGSAMGIAIANRKNRCDFGALSSTAESKALAILSLTLFCWKIGTAQQLSNRVKNRLDTEFFWLLSQPDNGQSTFDVICSKAHISQLRIRAIHAKPFRAYPFTKNLLNFCSSLFLQRFT